MACSGDDRVEVRSTIGRVSNRSFADRLCLLAALVAPVVSFLISLYSEDAQWFERSGSITVLLAAYVEYRQVSRSESQKRGAPIASVRINELIPGTRSRVDEMTARIALGLIVLGTVIWGYGTPLFKLCAASV